jgi:hypothetical protein
LLKNKRFLRSHFEMQSPARVLHELVCLFQVTARLEVHHLYWDYRPLEISSGFGFGHAPVLACN